MSRINTNINSLQAIRSFGKNNADLATRLQRLSTGLRINTGKDAPAGLIASETLRSEIQGITQAIDNTNRANNVINTAEGALSEVNALLLEIQSLTIEAANTGALSRAEIEANQLQLDQILNSVNRIANTTQFAGIKLLDGSLDYTTSGVASTTIDIVTINSAKLPDNGFVTVSVEVTASAQLGAVTYSGGPVNGPVTIEVAGVDGSEQISLASGATASNIVAAVNQLVGATGVSATATSGGAVVFNTTSFGSESFVTVRTVSGNFTTDVTTDNGEDAGVNINGAAADVRGNVASLRTSSLELSLTLDRAFAQSDDSTTFAINGGGAKFQIGSEVNRNGQINIGIQGIATTRLGDNVVGYLSSLRNGGENSLVGGNTLQAQKILKAAISQVATLRGRLGAIQKNVLETNVNSLGVTLENVTASESAIRDADFAKETAALTRAQILTQANTSVLSQANTTPQNVLSLLR